jgi:hypothetical protein
MDLAALPVDTGHWAGVADQEAASHSGAGILTRHQEEYSAEAGNTADIRLRPAGQAPQPQPQPQPQNQPLVVEECMVAAEGTEEPGSFELAIEVLTHRCQSKQQPLLHWPGSMV